MKTVILCGGKGTRLKEETDYPFGEKVEQLPTNHSSSA